MRYEPARERDGGSAALAARGYARTVERKEIPSIQWEGDRKGRKEIGEPLAAQRALVEQCDVALEATQTSRVGLQNTFQRKRLEHEACIAAEGVVAERVARATKAAECAHLRSQADASACAWASLAFSVCESYRDCRSSSTAAYEEAWRGRCIALGLSACGAVHPLPPATPCPVAEVRPCSPDGLLELDTGAKSETWSAPCSTCPAMAKASSAEPPAAEASATAEILATAQEAPPVSLRARLEPWLSSAKELAWITVSPRRRSAVTLSLLGQRSAQTTSKALGQAKSPGQCAAIFLVVPLLALGIAVFCTVFSSPPSSTGRTSRHGSGSPYVADSRMGPRARRGQAAGPVHGAGDSSSGSTDERPRTGYMHGGPLQSSLSPSSKEKRQPSREEVVPVSLCPELSIPAASEVVLGIPCFGGAAPGQLMLKTITDRNGQPILTVGLTSSAAGKDCILLAKKDQRKIAYCETGAAVRAEGWVGKIFRWNGELYARIKEASGDDGGSEPSSPTSPGPPLKAYVVLSAGSGPQWNLWATGSIEAICRPALLGYPGERSLTVESGGNVIAVASPGGTSDSYSLRLGPSADSCTVIIALMAIERLSAQPVDPLRLAASRSNSRQL